MVVIFSSNFTNYVVNIVKMELIFNQSRSQKLMPSLKNKQNHLKMDEIASCEETKPISNKMQNRCTQCQKRLKIQDFIRKR